jgi:hypothetical protein
LFFHCATYLVPSTMNSLVCRLVLGRTNFIGDFSCSFLKVFQSLKCYSR